MIYFSNFEGRWIQNEILCGHKCATTILKRSVPLFCACYTILFCYPSIHFLQRISFFSLHLSLSSFSCQFENCSPLLLFLSRPLRFPAIHSPAFFSSRSLTLFLSWWELKVNVMAAEEPLSISLSQKTEGEMSLEFFLFSTFLFRLNFLKFNLLLSSCF
jgi:hypothetical protein